MAAVMFERGKALDFVATRDFSLNCEEKALKSIKVHKDETISYDGSSVSYMKSSGEVVSGTCPGLKTAINVFGWLRAKNGKEVIAPIMTIPQQEVPDFDNLRGGNFQTYAEKTMGGVRPKAQVIHEEDRIVRPAMPRTEPKEQVKGGRLEVSGDQVVVKKVTRETLVNSSTSSVRTEKRSPKVILSDEMGSESSQPMVRTKRQMEATAAAAAPKRKASFVVDSTTPNVPEDATLKDLKRAKGASDPLEDQGARVVKKIKPAVVEMDGQAVEKEGIRFEKIKSPVDMTITTKVGPGGDGIGDQGGQVVRKIGASKVATAVNVPKLDTTVEISELDNNVSIPETKKESTDYLGRLPDGWGKMHWVQKEKYIKSLTDVGFIMFIKSVETAKAVQDACAERLKALSC